MALDRLMERGRWQDWANVAFGVWLLVSPGLLGYTDSTAADNSHLLGVIVALLALAAAYTGRVWEEWIALVIAVWLLLSPFVLGYTLDLVALWNHLILGLLIGANALWAMQRQRAEAN